MPVRDFSLPIRDFSMRPSFGQVLHARTGNARSVLVEAGACIPGWFTGEWTTVSHRIVLTLVVGLFERMLVVHRERCVQLVP